MGLTPQAVSRVEGERLNCFVKVLVYGSEAAKKVKAQTIWAAYYGSDIGSS